MYVQEALVSSARGIEDIQCASMLFVGTQPVLVLSQGNLVRPLRNEGLHLTRKVLRLGMIGVKNGVQHRLHTSVIFLV